MASGAHWLRCQMWVKTGDVSRPVGGCALHPNCCINCGGVGIWRSNPGWPDDLCQCQDCWAADEVRRAVERQAREAAARRGAGDESLGRRRRRARFDEWEAEHGASR